MPALMAVFLSKDGALVVKVALLRAADLLRQRQGARLSNPGLPELADTYVLRAVNELMSDPEEIDLDDRVNTLRLLLRKVRELIDGDFGDGGRGGR
jgi:hypothetical protein